MSRSDFTARLGEWIRRMPPRRRADRRALALAVSAMVALALLAGGVAMAATSHSSGTSAAGGALTSPSASPTPSTGTGAATADALPSTTDSAATPETSPTSAQPVASTSGTASPSPGSTASTGSTANPAPATSAANGSGGTGGSGFQGIFAFSGDNSSDLATDPDVAGRSLVYYWAQLEPQPGQYDWSIVDRDMQPWIAAGKKVILRVAVAGWAAWDTSADSAHGTPQWVYAQGVKSVTEQDGAVFPEYWNPTFLSNLNTFLHAFAARYDGNPHVALVDAAVGVGGETKPDSEKNPNLLSLWQSIGYTDPVWWQTVQQIIDMYAGSFHTTPIAVMPDKTFLGGAAGYNEQKTLAYAVSKGAWLQDNGLIPARTLSGAWQQTPLVSEQLAATTSPTMLSQELQAALSLRARIILVFTSDLTNPQNTTVIHQTATQATSPSTPPTGTSTSTGTPATASSSPTSPPSSNGAVSTTTPQRGTTTTTPGHSTDDDDSHSTSHHKRHAHKRHHSSDST